MPVPNPGCLPVTLKTNEIDGHHESKPKQIAMQKEQGFLEVVPMTVVVELTTARTHVCIVLRSYDTNSM